MSTFGRSSVLNWIARDLWCRFWGHRPSVNDDWALELQQRWRPRFEKRVAKQLRDKLPEDIIIRDFKRIDRYPDAEEGPRGISPPWFSAGLVGTYDTGILLALGWSRLIKETVTEKWRYIDYWAGETGDLKAILIGRVAYENIEAVDWEGDDYYRVPHIYCHFDRQHHGPYDQLAFCEERVMQEGPKHYAEIASYDDVRHLSALRGVKGSA
jgi:hypothetical protein